MNRLENKVALITGAASGIGSACSLRLAQEGAKVVGFDASDTVDDVWASAVEIAVETEFYTGDVRDEEQVGLTVKSIIGRFGRIDILINCAGVAGGGPVHSLSVEEWDRVVDTNLKGTFLFCKHVLAKMVEQKSGSIVNIASIEGIEGTEGGSMYNASKGGVVLLTKNMALDYARKGIRVNVVCPGFSDTPMARNVFGNEVMAPYLDTIIESVALNRLGQPEEIANAVLFLASDEASYITGQSLIVDGGLTAGHRIGITRITGLED